MMDHENTQDAAAARDEQAFGDGYKERGKEAHPTTSSPLELGEDLYSFKTIFKTVMSGIRPWLEPFFR